MGVISTAVKLHEVEPKDNGYNIHVTAEPDKPEPGTLVDARGDTLPVKKEGWMASLDERGAKEITLRQSTIVFLSAGPAVLTFIFALLISWSGFIRGDENVRVTQASMQTKLDETRQDVKEMKGGFDATKDQIKDLLHAIELLNTKVESYNLGQGDGRANHPPQKKEK